MTKCPFCKKIIDVNTLKRETIKSSIAERMFSVVQTQVFSCPKCDCIVGVGAI